MKTLLETILSSTKTGLPWFNEMVCIAHDEHNECVKVREELGIKSSKIGLVYTDEGYTLTDNGALDLEQKGMKGVYVWVGFHHGNWAKDRRLREGLFDFAEKVGDIMKDIFGGRVRIEDKIAKTDMCRIYIEMK